MTDGQKTILLVEDEDVVRTTLAAALETAGYTVVQAPDGEAGLAMALEKHPLLVLTDLNMPKKGGLEMLRELRRDDWGSKVEVIILTNISDASALETAMTEGAFFYMIKGDSSMADIVAKVKSRIG